MYIIGTDIGSISIATVALDLQGKIVASDYRFHQGEREKTLRESLAALGIEDAVAISRTSTSPDMLHYARIVDEKVAYIGAAKRLYGTIGSLLVVGAETFSIIHFGEDGSYKRLRTNSSCAAGTGSFLDQQASRLSLEDSSELSRLALENRGEVPKIASRCAVFAKTDLIHAQAEGYGLSEICDGLCLGLARNILDTLVSDELPPQPLIFEIGRASCRERV
jgi:activator of 2-hydroxyglutaryl-CoA dehydratase